MAPGGKEFAAKIAKAASRKKAQAAKAKAEAGQSLPPAEGIAEAEVNQAITVASGSITPGILHFVNL